MHALYRRYTRIHSPILLPLLVSCLYGQCSAFISTLSAKYHMEYWQIDDTMCSTLLAEGPAILPNPSLHFRPAMAVAVCCPISIISA